MTQFLNPFGRFALWAANKQNRLRLKGVRVEVVACIITKSPEDSILLIKSGAGGAWIPPQEGVEVNEKFSDAMFRCLHEECLFEFPENKSLLAQTFNHKITEYLGTIELPKNRWGSRNIVKDSHNIYLANIKMKRKAYWVSINLIKDQDSISVSPNGTEAVDLKWFPISEAKRVIKESNPEDKSRLLIQALNMCENYM